MHRQKSECSDPLAQLDLSGFIHVWGPPYGGKTLFAVAAASFATRYGRVEWLSLDGKKGFLYYLKKTVSAYGGRESNLAITLTNNHQNALEQVITLPTRIDESVVLIVIDPLTRTLDLSRDEPILWGRGLIEEVLPTLGYLVHGCGINVLAINETRMLKDIGISPIHHDTIARWSDYELLIRRLPFIGRSEILICKIKERSQQTIGSLLVLPSGIVHVLSPQETGCTEEWCC